MMRIFISQIAIAIDFSQIIAEIVKQIIILMRIISNVDYVMATFTLWQRSKVSIMGNTLLFLASCSLMCIVVVRPSNIHSQNSSPFFLNKKKYVCSEIIDFFIIIFKK